MTDTSDLESIGVRRARLATLLRARSALFRAFPMSFQQRGIWFIEQFQPGTAAYHLPLTLDIAEPRDQEVWRRASDAVVAHHPSLRTTFGFDGTTFEPIQRVHPRMSVPLSHSDLSARPDGQSRLRELSRQHTTAPFDLENGPLVRMHLVNLPGRRQRLLVTLHHLVADGWSLHLLKRDLELACQALSQGRAPALRRPPRDYHDWSVWQREYAEASWRPPLGYYRDLLAGWSAWPGLPTDRPRPAAPTLEARRHEWTIPDRVLAGLQALARGSGTTLYSVLLSALALTIYRRTAQPKVVIGTPMANRAHRTLEEVIGNFVNMGVMPVTVSAADTLISLLPQVHELMVSALSFQDLPFERLVEALGPDRRRAGAAPVLQVTLALQNTPDAWETERFNEPTGVAKFDLSFNAVQAPDGLRVDCVYATELFGSATVAALCDELTRALAAGAAGAAA